MCALTHHIFLIAVGFFIAFLRATQPALIISGKCQFTFFTGDRAKDKKQFSFKLRCTNQLGFVTWTEKVFIPYCFVIV